MEFLMYTLGDETTPVPPPTPQVMAEMGKFMQESKKAGILLATGGMGPLSEGTTVRLKDGKFSATDGPYTESKELIGGWALIRVGSKEEAIKLAERFLRINGGGESRIRQVFLAEG